eukprot:8049826-Pyramimonas_sp.AAC.1
MLDVNVIRRVAGSKALESGAKAGRPDMLGLDGTIFAAACAPTRNVELGPPCLRSSARSHCCILSCAASLQSAGPCPGVARSPWFE